VPLLEKEVLLRLCAYEDIPNRLLKNPLFRKFLSGGIKFISTSEAWLC
jgi:hypothetical protein